jgi:serine/threonine-protein kinase
VLGGKYRLVRQLDQGGMSSVWLAEHLGLNAPVAVKLISPEVAHTEDGIQRFLREARTAASLRSAHVVQIFDYGVEAGTPYIVMELLRGETLATRLRRVGQLSPAETTVVLRHVARAVGRAHDAGVIHRDLKPANVFICHDEDQAVIKLLDFGIAKATASMLGSSLASQTRTGEFIGTPMYASPEQVEGVRGLDHRTDIWSLGILAYECLLGRPPFAGESFASLLLCICSRPLPVPSSRGAVPPGFDAWFGLACARDRNRRFQSARAAAEALRQALAEPLLEGGRHEPGKSGAAVPRAAVTRRRFRARARALRGWVAGSVALGVLALGALALGSRGIAPPESAERVQQLEQSLAAATPAAPAPAASALPAAEVARSAAPDVNVPGVNSAGIDADGANSAGVDSAGVDADGAASPAAPAPKTSAAASSRKTRASDSRLASARQKARPRPQRTQGKRAARAQRPRPAAATTPSSSSSASTSQRAANTKPDCRKPFWIDQHGIRRVRLDCI